MMETKKSQIRNRLQREVYGQQCCRNTLLPLRGVRQEAPAFSHFFFLFRFQLIGRGPPTSGAFCSTQALLLSITSRTVFTDTSRGLIRCLGTPRPSQVDVKSTVTLSHNSLLREVGSAYVDCSSQGQWRGLSGDLRGALG